MLKFDGKTAIVTGCGSVGVGVGNGMAISALLARQGAHVIGIDRSRDAADTTRKLVESEGGKLDVVICDVTNAEQIIETVKECHLKFGPLNVLVNNVGLSKPGGVVDMDVSVWDKQFDVNLKSVFLMCRSMLPLMEKQGGGVIVNVSSLSGIRYTGKDQIAYSTSKAALIQFTRMVAVMHAPTRIRANCVIPGLINTPLVHRLADEFGNGDYQAFAARRDAQVPLGHMGDAWDVAAAALFLASDEARYITGTELLVDGGLASTVR